MINFLDLTSFGPPIRSLKVLKMVVIGLDLERIRDGEEGLKGNNLGVN